MSGERRAGSMSRIHGDGFSGIVATIWDEEARTIRDRYAGGERYADTSDRSNTTVALETCLVDLDKGKRCFTGRTIVASSREMSSMIKPL